MKLLVYEYDGTTVADASDISGAEISVWRPSFQSWRPSDKTLKYVAYSLFHWARVFRSKDYCAVTVSEHRAIKASMLVVPSYFIWPFMSPDDLQFTYVITAPSARRQGWGSYLVNKGLEQFGRDGRRIWYVTDTNNVASQNLAEKSGFKLAGTAAPRTSRMQRVHLDAGRVREKRP